MLLGEMQGKQHPASRSTYQKTTTNAIPCQHTMVLRWQGIAFVVVKTWGIERNSLGQWRLEAANAIGCAHAGFICI